MCHFLIYIGIKGSFFKSVEGKKKSTIAQVLSLMKVTAMKSVVFNASFTFLSLKKYIYFVEFFTAGVGSWCPFRCELQRTIWCLRTKKLFSNLTLELNLTLEQEILEISSNLADSVK